MTFHAIGSWRDIIEILFFSTIFYHTAVWLKKDRTKNLLSAFYGFIFLAYGAHLVNLPSVSYMLLISWPIALMLFIVMHQKTLQHNFIALKSIPSPKAPTIDWIETLMAHCLGSLNNSTPFYCIIENSDAIDLFLQASLMIEAPLQKELLTFIRSSNSFDAHAMLWINAQGIVRGINCSYSYSLDKRHNSQDWAHNTLLHTSNTDVLAFFADPATHSFTLICKGKITHQLNAQHMLHHLTKEYKNKSKTHSQPSPAQASLSQQASLSHQTPAQKQSSSQN